MPIHIYTFNCPIVLKNRFFCANSEHLTQAKSIIQTFAKTIHRSPKIKSTDYFLQKAIESENLKNFSQAIHYYTLAIKSSYVDQEIAEAKSNRGHIYLITLQLDNAIKDLTEALDSIHRPTREIFKDLASAYQEKNDNLKSIEVLKKGLKTLPNSFDLRYRLGRVYINIDIKQSLYYFKETIQMFENDLWFQQDQYFVQFLPYLKQAIFHLEQAAGYNRDSSGWAEARYLSSCGQKLGHPPHRSGESSSLEEGVFQTKEKEKALEILNFAEQEKPFFF